MRKNKESLVISWTLFLLCAQCAYGQNPSASELLQKGIYLQETVGDLDGAIKAYRQAEQMAVSQALAAQAEYRLGVCLLKKGQHAEAIGAFQELIKKHPEQGELVSKARESLAEDPASQDLPLLEIPWRDGEFLEYRRTNTQNSARNYKLWYSLQASKTHSGRWLLEERVPGGLTSLEFESETMRPIASSESFGPADFHVHYKAQLAQTIEDSGKVITQVVFDGPVYDLREVPLVLRRLPWKEGYKTHFSVLLSIVNSREASVLQAVQRGQVESYVFAVSGEEDVQTPAGSFHCYRIERTFPAPTLPSFRETFWISTDAAHLIVKRTWDDAVEELSAWADSEPREGVYKDEKTGVSFKVPAGWVAQALPSEKGFWGKLLDLHSGATVGIHVSPCDVCNEESPAALRVEAEKQLEAWKKHRMAIEQPGSWQTRHLGTHTAVSCIEDLPGFHLMENMMWTTSATWQAQVDAEVDPEKFTLLRPTFDAIFDSLVLK